MPFVDAEGRVADRGMRADGEERIGDPVGIGGRFGMNRGLSCRWKFATISSKLGAYTSGLLKSIDGAAAFQTSSR